MNGPEPYEIRVEGHASSTLASRFDRLSLGHDAGGETVLTGLLDQAALHGVLVGTRYLGLKLVSVRRQNAIGS